MSGTFNRLLLLLWKNWVLQRRRRKKLVVDVAIPLFIGAFLLFIRYETKIRDVPHSIKYFPFGTNYIPKMDSQLTTMLDHDLSSFVMLNTRDASGVSIPGLELLNSSSYLNSTHNPSSFKTPNADGWILLWSPSHNVVDSIMKSACQKMKVSGKAVSNSEELEKIMTSSNLVDERKIILAGLVFPDEIISKNDIPSNIHVKVRFPAELRFRNSSEGSMATFHWMTGLVFPLFQIPGPRDAIVNEGGPPGYYKEGFLGLQNAVSQSLLEYHLKKNPQTVGFDIKLKRFPYEKYVIDPLIIVMQNLLAFLIVISFLFSVNTIVEKITSEKERRLKVVMNIMGLSDSLRWTSWFVYSLIFFLLLISIIVTVFKTPLIHGRPVFPYSDWSCLMLFFICYSTATITFCFLISTIFSKAGVASTVSGMAWFLIFVPFYIIQMKYAEVGFFIKCVSSLLLNTGMGIGLHIILMYEGTGTGIQWNNLMKPALPEDGMTVLISILIMLFDGVVHLCLALYIENVFPGEFGTPLPLYYPLQRSYWFPKAYTDTDDEKDYVVEKIDYPSEEEPKNLVAGIRIKNLRKIYGKKKEAVKNLTLNAYEGQTTVLMGFNGAGKTTTISLLTGIYPPTSGSALIAGYDIKKNIKVVRKNLGFCPQHNVLFDLLTVEEHIWFFGKLKELDDAQIAKDTEKYLTLLNLNDKRKTLAKHLSGGMKRKLSVALAMCGDTKVLLLDEPTAGMDSKARRSFWDILVAEKKNRTVLITTHHLDEADLLGDRVAIMSRGSLNCCGSTFFLKKQYPCGYRLTIVKNDNCVMENVTELIQRYVPGDLQAEDVGLELSYKLPEKYSNKFEVLFNALAEEKETLKIGSFGVTPTSLEDVFHRIAQEMVDENNLKSNEKTLPLRYEIGGPNDSVKVSISDNKEVGYSLVKNQIIAMLYKHVISTLRSWKSYFLLIIITICGLLNAIFTTRINGQLIDLPPRTLSLDMFPNPTVSVKAGENCSGVCLEYFEAYNELLKEQNIAVVRVDKKLDMDDHLLEECEKSVYNYRTKHILGTTFDVSETSVVLITGWFNAQPYHTPPVALSNIYNSIFRATINSNTSVSFKNVPLPFKDDTKIILQRMLMDKGFQMAIFIAFTYIFVSSSFILFPVQERETKAKLLQLVSGVSSYIFWSVAFVWNLLISFGPNIALIAVLALFQEEGFREPEELCACVVVLVGSFVSLLPLMYLASQFCSTPSLGFILAAFFNNITGIFTMMVVVILDIPLLDLADLSKILDWIFSIFPLFSMGRSLHHISVASSRLKMCKPIYEEQCLKIESFQHICCKVPEKCPGGVCLSWVESFFDLDVPGIGRYVTFLYASGLVYFILLIAVENGIFNLLKSRTKPLLSLNKEEDADIVNEREKVIHLPEEERKNYSLILSGVSKFFGKNLVVNNLYLAVPEGECFGLLGTNGAGKTTTFTILAGGQYADLGNAYVKGISLKDDVEKVRKLIGYCPQFDALFEDLTGREHLHMYCLIRGIPARDVGETAKELARELLFEELLDKKVREYSGGNKRKLSTAIALIGNPPIVYLDEPTAGVDPVARRHLWAVITKIRKRGTTIILTSHSMEECEALCTRLTIMVKGEFKCLGTTQYLKSKFCQGFSLSVKVKKKTDEKAVDGEACMEEIRKFVTQNFPGAVEMEKHEELLVFKIPSVDLSLATMFGLMESAKERLNIEDYSLGQTTIEQILLMITDTADEDKVC